MAATPLRIGVVGLGAMGSRHARCVAAHAGATLTMAVEPDAARSKTEIGCPVVADAAALIGQVDAAIIAVPTALHAAIAVPLLEAGIACLIEKPFVASPAEADMVKEAARRGNTVVRVGHIERFNPAIVALLAKPPRTIRSITARRLNAASARVTDIDVVIDLMVHDLDIILALKGNAVTKVTAEGSRDQAMAKLTFDDGALATLAASRRTSELTRDLRIITPERELQVDYVRRTLVEMRKTGETLSAKTLDVREHDALTAQLSAFLHACQGRLTGVTPGEALAVMELAWRIQAALKL